MADRARSWSTRCLHESQLYDHNSFLTLTYSDENLVYGAEGATLHLPHLQNFFKSLRHEYECRYFACGEYGDKTHRPHYHVLLFGVDFKSDRTISTLNKFKTKNDTLYESKSLSSHWKHGNAIIGDLTHQSINYVTRYLLKKAKAERRSRSPAHEGEAEQPEFQVMSRRPGLGSGWYENFRSDLYPHDNVVINGKKMPIPRFYSEKYRNTNPEQYAIIKACREIKLRTQGSLNAAEAAQKARSGIFNKSTI